ncbi:hypothetical protein PNEG_00159 [Pneumocystis murina B123]|uniref:Uncharacterized protein n=1 Tax=Pneumocystis murina (strain B123) TaxID=1069680 RepID=M7PCU7_PNEMU|nr:hypothetical protein PNEG_00159 [Pneumocystis murina B123]EMR11725.1 hypothetical protein PNEG_00159 [Pneumocystis murina B123]
MRHPIQLILANTKKEEIYIGVGKNVYILDSKTGKNLANWTLPEANNVQLKETPINQIQCMNLSAEKDLLFISSNDKLLRIFDISEGLKIQNEIRCNKRPCVITVVEKLSKVFVGDKFGDVYSFLLNENSTVETNTGPIPPNLVLGHVSMITDMIVTKDSNYLITSDRDEHIKISCLPKCVVIKGYCLGHQEFVSKLSILSWNPDILISGGGDPYLFVWNWRNQELLSKIDLIKLLYKKDQKKYVLDNEKIAIIGIQQISTRKEIAIIIQKIQLLFIFGDLASEKPILKIIEPLPGDPLSITLDKNDVLWISLDNSTDYNIPFIYLYPKNEDFKKIVQEIDKTISIEVDYKFSPLYDFLQIRKSRKN